MIARTLSDGRKRWNRIVGARTRWHLCVFERRWPRAPDSARCRCVAGR